MRPLFSPASLAWLGGHSFCVLLGLLMMTSEGQRILGPVVGLSLGTGLIATGIAGLVLYLYIRTTFDPQDKLQILTDAGLTNVFRYRSMRIKAEYDRRLEKARQIDLIGYGLKAFREDYSEEFIAWSGRAYVRILLTDPDFPSTQHSFANIRDAEENRQVGETRESVLTFEQEVNGLEHLDRTRFQIRRMPTIPTINLLRIDDEIFWGPYLMGEQSRNTPTLLPRRGGFMFDALSRHFDATWEASAPQPLLPQS